MNSTFEEKKLFLSRFLQLGKTISSFCPSSIALAKATCQFINPAIPQTIIELGAGTGPVTRAALKKMHPDSTLIAIESDPELGAFLQKQSDCAKAKIIIGDAGDLAEHLDKLNVKTIDVMISGLPLPNMPEKAVKNILTVLANKGTNPGTPFCQITIVPWVYISTYKRLFEDVQFQMVWKNMPPGGVYICRNPRN